MNQRVSGSTEVKTYNVKALLRFARQGRLRLPQFQRPPRWRARNVVDLFDSIQRGYPIGTLLLGEGPAEDGEGSATFGAFRGDVAAREDALFVVDGQQRLSAILGALLHPDEAPRGDVHAIWYDLLEKKFVHVRREPPPVSVPLRALGEPTTTLRWADAWPLRRDYEHLANEAFDLATTLADFDVSVAIVRGNDEPSLREIFRRLNTEGVAMRADEVFNALFGHLRQGRLAVTAARVSGLGFGAVNEQTVLRALLAVEGLDPGTTAEKLKSDEVPAMAERTENALRATFNFLAAEVEVPHLALLPYSSLPLRVLARFFARFARPSPRALVLLRRWFWRGCVSRQFSSASQGLVRKLQKLLDAPSDEAAARRLLADQGATVPRLELRPDLVWKSRNAECRIVALALLDGRPTDPTSGVTLTVDEIAQRLRGGTDDEESGDEAREGEAAEGQSLSELCVDITGASGGPLVRRITVLSAPPADWWDAATPDTLAGHALDGACVDALRAWRDATDASGRDAALAAFDAARAKVLGPRVEAWLAERCGAGDDDVPSVAEIVRLAEEQMSAP